MNIIISTALLLMMSASSILPMFRSGNISSDESQSGEVSLQTSPCKSGFSSSSSSTPISPNKFNADYFTSGSFSDNNSSMSRRNSDVDMSSEEEDDEDDVVIYNNGIIKNAPTRTIVFHDFESEDALLAHIQTALSRNALADQAASSFQQQHFFHIEQEAFRLIAEEQNNDFNQAMLLAGDHLRCVIAQKGGVTLGQLSINFMHFIYPEAWLCAYAIGEGNFSAILKGFHADYGLRLLRAGIYRLKNVSYISSQHPYEADVIMFGVNLGHKTFFPAGWSYEMLTQKIIQALRNPDEASVTIRSYNRTIVFEGMTDGGMRINFIIDFNGEIKTAYPVLANTTSRTVSRVLFH